MYVHASNINVYVHITIQTTQERVPQNEYCWIPSERVGIMWGERLGVSVRGGRELCKVCMRHYSLVAENLELL